MVLSLGRLNSSAEAAVRKAVSDSADDEILLDCFAQWASNIVGKNTGYGIEENYHIIRENLCGRFDISDEIASEFVSKLREYGTQFFLSGADIPFVRATIIEELMGESGEKWRRGIQVRLAKSSMNAKRLTYMLLYLIKQGFEATTLETSLGEIQAFHTAAFGSSFQVAAMQDELTDIGILNRLAYTSEDSMTKQHVHTIITGFSAGKLGLRPEDLKIQDETKEAVSHMIEKRMFDQLRLLDDVSHENFGIKRFENGFGSLVPDKRVFGVYENYAAVSPFLIEEFRDHLHSAKQARLDNIETLVERGIYKTINESWTQCRVDFFRLKRERALWLMENGADPKLYVYLTLWTTESDLETLRSKFDVPNATGVIAIVLNESPEIARSNLMDKLGKCGELHFIFASNQKEFKAETLVGIPPQFSTDIVEALTNSLNSKTKKGHSQEPKAINPDNHEIHEPEGPKILIGSQETKEIYWVPSRERNYNIGIFGDPKNSRTEIVKRILLELRKAGVPFLVIDSSGGYLPRDNTNGEFGTVIGPGEIGVNPLELEHGASPRDREYRVLEVLESVYDLKDNEVSFLQRAIKKAYAFKGIMNDNPKSWDRTPPTLQDVRHVLESFAQEGKGHEKDASIAMLQRMGHALGHTLFSEVKTKIPFEKLVIGPVVIDLSGLKGDGVISLATEFLMGRVPYFTESRKGDLRLFVALNSSKLLERNSASLRLLREARQRGIGMIYSSDSPSNLGEIALNNTATILSLRQSDSKNAKALADYLDVGEQRLNKNLSEKFSAVTKFSSQYGVTSLTIVPYSQNDQINA